MKRSVLKRIIFLLIISLMFVGSYKVYLTVERNRQYQSLDNVFKEMNYAAVHSEGLLKLPSLNKVLGSHQGLRKEDSWAGLDIPNPLLNKQEYIKLDVYREGTMLLEYRKQLSNSSYLFISWYYALGTVQEIVSVTFSDISDVYVRQVIKHEENIFQEKGITSEEDVYRRRAEIYTGQPSLKSKSDIISYLKSYEIDELWVKEKSDFVLNNVLLKPWFEKGSQRYSFDNLGNLKIERSEMLE